ncbi:MAG: CDP-alcohol phosphatidyltransferase family protein [Acidimicrobiales bacterium]
MSIIGPIGPAPFDPDDERFGPSALMTPANAVTIIRLLVSPALLLMILGEPSSWPAVSFWIALAVTDGVDGFLARRFGSTRSGAFLDPLADKVLVLGALYALVAANRFWWLPVALISAREILISLYRTRLGRLGLAVPARPLAKVKTVVQEVAVGFALLPLTVDQPALANTFLYLAVVLTLITGAQYLMDGRSAATTMGTLEA